MHEKRPATFWAKVDLAAHWAFLGILVGVFAYPILWGLMEPGGEPSAAGIAVVLLVISPWGWAFLALCALSIALVPVMAIYRGTESNYGRSLYLLASLWAGGLLVTGTIAVLVYRLTIRVHGFRWDELSVYLLTLSIPIMLAFVVIVFGLVRGGR